MGYDAFIRVGIDNPISQAEVNVITAALKEKYQAFKESDGSFPWIGEQIHTGSWGFGTGPTDKFTEHLTNLFSDYPDVSFSVYFSYWDNMILEIYKCYQGEVNLVKTINMDGIVIDGVKLYLTLGGVDIDLEITEDLTE